MYSPPTVARRCRASRISCSNSPNTDARCRSSSWSDSRPRIALVRFGVAPTVAESAGAVLSAAWRYPTSATMRSPKRRSRVSSAPSRRPPRVIFSVRSASPRIRVCRSSVNAARSPYSPRPAPNVDDGLKNAASLRVPNSRASKSREWWRSSSRPASPRPSESSDCTNSPRRYVPAPNLTVEFTPNSVRRSSGFSSRTAVPPSSTPFTSWVRATSP